MHGCAAQRHVCSSSCTAGRPGAGGEGGWAREMAELSMFDDASRTGASSSRRMACCERSMTLCAATLGCPSPTLRLAFCTLFTLFTSSRSSSCFRILLILGCGRLVRCFMSRVQMPAGVAPCSAV